MRLLVLGLLGATGVAIAAWSGVPGTDARSEQASAAAFPSSPPTGAQPFQELTPFGVARAERFLESRVACLGCHRIGGSGGQIGPSLDRLGDRVDAAYVSSVIREPTATIPGTLMPRQKMPDREVERLTSYLLSRPAVDAAPSTGVTPEAPPTLAESERNDGAALYARHCAACHGSEGRGNGWNAPNLPVAPTAHADGTRMRERPDDSLFDAIYAGAFVLDGSPRMPPFGEMLSTEQIQARVVHIRVLCRCSQPAWAGGG